MEAFDYSSREHYYVQFEVAHEVEPGQSIAVIGDGDHLGQWSTPNYHLQMIDSSLWQTKEPLKLNCS